MDILNEEIYYLLIKKHPAPCISIYMPTHKIWNEVNQDLLRYKNILKTVKDTLLEREFSENEVPEILERADKLLDDRDFWNHQNEGLAVFISRNEFYYLRLPIKFEETFFISNMFLTKPLLPILTRDKSYYVLALDQKNLRFYESFHYGLREINLPNTPKSIEEIAVEAQEPSLQFQAQSSQGKQRRNAITFGKGGIGDFRNKTDIHRFFLEVNKGVYDHLKKENAPLVLAGVEFLIPMYKEVNSYNYIFNKHINVDAENISLDHLYHRANETLNSYFEMETDKSINQFWNLINTGKASTDVEEILQASFTNRIASLFIDPNKTIWGKFDLVSYTADIHNEYRSGDKDLIDLASSQTMLHNGTVYSLTPDKLPNNKHLAAVFRY